MRITSIFQRMKTVCLWIIKEARWKNRRIARHLGRTYGFRLFDAGKSGSKTANLSVRVSEVDFGPQWDRETGQLSVLMSQFPIHRYQPSVRWPAHKCEHEHWQMTEKAKFALTPTVTSITPHFCTPSSLVTVIFGSCNLELHWLGKYSVYGSLPYPTLLPECHRRRVWKRSEKCNDPALTIANHIDPQNLGIVYGAISFYTWTRLVVISNILTAQQNSGDILWPVFCRYYCNIPDFPTR